MTNITAPSTSTSNIGWTSSALTTSRNEGDEAALTTLPPPSDPLAEMIGGSDVGSAIAALVMMTQKELRKTARSGRDLAYAQQEQAQAKELEHMRDAASTRLVTGLLDGGLKLGSAGFSMASAASSIRAAGKGYELEGLQRIKDPSMGDISRMDGLQETIGAFKTEQNHLDGLAKGLEAGGVISKSVGECLASADDREAKAAANGAMTFKRLAEGRGDDARDADKSIDRAMEFLQQWLNTKASIMQAATSFRA